MAFNYRKYSGIPKISSFVVLISFLLPFFVVRCNDQVIDEISGIELISGTTIRSADDGFLEGMSEEETEENTEPTGDYISTKIFAIFCLFTAILATAVSFFKNNEKIVLAIAVAGIGALSLLGLYIEVNGESGKQDGGMITIEIGLGFVLALFGFIIQIVYYLMVAKVLRDRENHTKTVDDLRR